jgi:hypothetical protein
MKNFLRFLFVILMFVICSVVFADTSTSDPASVTSQIFFWIVLIASIGYSICCELIAHTPSLDSNSVIQLIKNICKTIAGK